MTEKVDEVTLGLLQKHGSLASIPDEALRRVGLERVKNAFGVHVRHVGAGDKPYDFDNVERAQEVSEEAGKASQGTPEAVSGRQ